MMCRDTSTKASDVFQIQDEVLAFDFDLAVTLRLFKFDNEKDAANRKFWVSLVGGESDDDGGGGGEIDGGHGGPPPEVW